MYFIINLTRTMLLTVLLFGSLPAQEKTVFSLETDPATFAFNGYALHLRVSPGAWPRIRLGAGGYAMDFPQLLVDTHPDNAGKGWDVRLKTGVGFFSEYFFNDERTGWFVGNQIAWQRYRIKNSALPGRETEYSILLVMPYAGYRWFPLSGGFYVQPWLGLGYARKISGTASLGTRQYAVSSLVPFVTVHLGYRF